MARITVEEVYIGEKYGVMSAVMAEYLRNGRPAEHDERTWVEMLIVKHALIAADKMKLEGDSISGMTDAKSFSSYVRWNALLVLSFVGSKWIMAIICGIITTIYFFSCKKHASKIVKLMQDR